jgi:hypothetical protein
MQRVVLALLLFSRRSGRAKTGGDRGISAQARGATSEAIELWRGAVQGIRKRALRSIGHIRRVVAGARRSGSSSAKVLRPVMLHWNVRHRRSGSGWDVDAQGSDGDEAGVDGWWMLRSTLFA